MRRPLLALAFVTALLAPAAGGANPRAEKKALRPADVRLAKSAVIRQADVGPDWVRIAVPKPDESQFSCKSFQPDLSRFTITGEATASFQFPSPPGAQIGSTVAVFATRAQAVGDFRLGAKPQLAHCLADQARRAFRGFPPSVQGRVLSARMVPAPRLGERAAAYAVRAELSGNGVVIPVLMDVVAIQRGRSVAALVFTGLGSRVPSQRYYAARVTARLR